MNVPSDKKLFKATLLMEVDFEVDSPDGIQRYTVYGIGRISPREYVHLLPFADKEGTLAEYHSIIPWDRIINISLYHNREAILEKLGHGTKITDLVEAAEQSGMQGYG